MKRAWTAVFFILVAGCTPVKKENVFASSEAHVDLRPYGATSGYQVYESPELLLKKIQDLGGPQKEFETNSDFAKRMAGFHKSVILSEISDSDIKFDKETGVVSFDSPMFDAIDLGYKPEKNILGKFGDSYLALDLSPVDRVKGSYVGQNAYGAQAEVDVVVSDRVYLIFPPFPKASARMVFSNLVSKLDISAKEFEAQRGNLRLAVLFEPRSRVLQADRHYGSATLTNKRDSTVNNYYVDMYLMGLGVVNIKTNKVYSERFRVRLKVL
ncbi:hypothetical protein [Pseudomonas viridiflava]|uniref:hypothetical protein n=1 Tax=Pseudomonas viridiflava TaxID=33069 RepID=UPI000F01E491|nr:hypothetical protein [Pseudomonas viridiflava]